MIYLDGAATTKPSEGAVRAMLEAAETFGNPSSLHRLGLAAEKLVEKSREAVARRLEVEKKTLYFTSGGTEANNLAIIGGAKGNSRAGKHVITTQMEHPSVLAAFRVLEEEGFAVTYLKPDQDGVLKLETLKGALRPDTCLVSVMHVNNETGMIQPVDQIKKILKERSPRALFHVDGVQAFGKIPCRPKAWGIDLYTVSAHKIHGPKGVGALYVGGGKLKPFIVGGEQQGEIRPGTENVMGICGFGAAAEEAVPCTERLRELRNQLKEGILARIPDVKINGREEASSGSILNVSFLGIKGEILLHSLEMKEIYVSTGSACSSHKPQPSHVLTSMGLSKKEIEGAVRISIPRTLTEEEVQTVLDALERETAGIRRYMG